MAIYGQDHLFVAEFSSNLGNAHRENGQYREAIYYLKKAHDISKSIYIDKAEQAREAGQIYTASLNNLGLVYQHMGLYNEVLRCFQESLEIRNRIHKEQPHLDIADSLDNLGIAYKDMEKYKLAIENCEQALNMRKFICGESHPTVAISYNTLGAIFLAKKEYNTAITQFTQSLNIRETCYGRQHPTVTESLNNLGLAHKELIHPSILLVNEELKEEKKEARI